ncbi:MAG: gliding motility lipoprotein GldH [Flavobacteriales bacterium]|nr:gliding motility lipoprotein GldH [Flavobacteriales bacterium]
MQNNKWLIFLFLVPGLVSCDTNKVYDEYMAIDGGVWLNEKVATFQFEAQDTVTAHNLYINVRNKGNYKYSNLYLFVTLKGPNGNELRDTVNCVLADSRGKWLGTGIGDLWDLRVPYVGGFKFAQKGTYVVSLEQAMREEKGLDGISDVGLRVEKADK